MPVTPYARLRALRRVLVSDVDGTLLEGGKAGRGCAALAERLEHAQAGLVLATGRDLELTLAATAELMAAGMPRPEALICSVGSEIYLGADDSPDEIWARHIADGWERERLRSALADVPGLQPQEDVAQRDFKLSYFFTEQEREPGGAVATAVRPGQTRVADERAREVTAAAGQAIAAAGLRARLIASAGSFLDVLPERASKGAAVNWLISLAAIDPRGVVVAGDSGNDREMLLSEHDGQPLLAVVVGNHESELADLAGRPNVYLAERTVCGGVLEGLVAHGW